MKSSAPEVLAVTPTQAGDEQILSECLSSVAAQTVPIEHVWELDDNYSGPAKLRDLMVSRSSAEWILPIECTDILDRNYVEKGLQHADEADIIYQWCRVPADVRPPNRLFNPKALRRYNYIPITSLIRREVLDELGGFTHNNPWELWLRALETGARFKCVPEVTWTFRPKPPTLAERAIMKGAIQKQTELQQLIDLIESRPQAETIMEIGTSVGGTLWLWCQLAAPNAFIISADLPSGPFGGVTNEEHLPKLLNYTTHQQRMQLFRGDSHKPEMLTQTKRVLGDRELDILFIDGDHTLEGVTQDWETFSPLVRSGGLVIFHDIVDHALVPDCQVKPLWDRLKTEHEVIEFVTPEESHGMGKEWGGIGVIVKG